MKKVLVHSKEIAVLSPGEMWGMPDEWADQIINRGKATEVKEETVKGVEPKPEIKLSETIPELDKIEPIPEPEKKLKKGGK